MEIPSNKTFAAFTLIVDVNGSMEMVRRGAGDLIAQFARDTLSGGVHAIESAGGETVAFMGDAFLAILPTVESLAVGWAAIAKDLDRSLRAAQA